MDDISGNNFPAESAVNPNDNSQTFSLSLSMDDVKSFAGWAAFVAIMDIICGAFACMTILGAAYGVTQIISGTKLYTASDNLRRYIVTNNYSMISESLYNMSKYFKLKGITVIIKIALTIIAIAIYILVIIAVASSSISSSGFRLDYLF